MSRYRHTPNKRKSNFKGPLIASIAIIAMLMLAAVGYHFVSKKTKNHSTPPVSQAAPRTPPPLLASPPITPVAPSVKPQQDPDHKKHPYPDVPAVVQEEPLSIARETRKGMLAIIIDDMGNSTSEARSLAAVGVPLTFSIIPGLRNYREVATFAASKGIEIMIHIPMQSKGWPQRRLEENGLLVSMSDSEIHERVAGFMRDLSRAVGANNHMGSEFTEHEDKMRGVLEALRGGGLYFVDSVTSPMTVAERLARELGMKTGRRHVFLDNEQNNAYIIGQLNQAIRRAKNNGSAIAICHPHPATIATLAATLPGLKAQGITLVPASSLVQ